MICADGRVVAQRGIVVSKLSADRIFVGDSDGTGFDFTGGGKPLTALPAILTALNATYTRNSVKNVVQNGALVSLSANQFGTSYDPVAATYGYVPEPAATNLATYSNDLSNAAWIKTGASASYAQGPSPDGSNNASKIIDTAVAEIHYVTPPAVSFSSGTVYTQSCYAKAAGINYLQIGLPVGSFAAASRRAVFNLSAGVVTSAEAGVTALIVDVGSGWYRCSIKATANANSTQSGHLMLSRSGALNDAYLGNGIDGVLVYNAQIETGSRATSPIYTAGSTASRSADVLTVPLWVNNLLNSVFAGGGAAPTSWTRPFATGSSAPEASGLYAGETAYLQSGTAQRPFLSQDFSAQANTTYQLSMIVESVTGSINAQNALLPNNALSGSVITYPICEANPSGGSGGIITTGKLVVQVSVSATGGTVNFRAGIGCSGSSTGTLKFLRPQIEAGSTATAYRPTTSTLESAANANIPGFSSAGYTLFADVRQDATLASTVGIVEVNDGTFSNRAVLVFGGGTDPTVQSVVGGVAQSNTSGSTFSGARGKIAGSYALNSVLASRNGAALTADTSAAMPAGLLALTIGTVFAGNMPFNGYLFRVGLIPQALTQAQINGLTT